MARPKLNIRFHDPNPMTESADRIAQIFIQASHLKFEKLLEAYAAGVASDEEESSGH